MRDYIKIIGGILILLLPLLFIGLIWFDTQFMFDLIVTDGILIGTCIILDKATEKL